LIPRRALTTVAAIMMTRFLRRMARSASSLPTARDAALLAGMLVLAGMSAGCARFSKDEPPEIYDTRADGEQQLAASLAEAKRTNKRVLLNLGANWCSDSQALFRLFNENMDIARTIEQNYVFEMIDVNTRGLGARNADLVERLGSPLQRGIPVLLILDANGNVLNRDPNERLSDSAHEHPGMVLAYLQKWAAPAPK
jgi:thiol:disulfide interchange protein